MKIVISPAKSLDFESELPTANARPAVYAFNGDVYNGLDAYSIPEEKLDKLQDTLRILFRLLPQYLKIGKTIN